MSADSPHESATARVHSWVRERILDGRLAGGRLLSEGEVAQAAGVSRTPVREAFLQLAAEGMLQLYPKRGALVLSVSAAELRDVLVARQLVEQWAVATAATAADHAHTAAQLRALTERARRALDERDEEAFKEADHGFHRRLVIGGGNELLARFYDSLHDRELRAGMVAVYHDAEAGTTSMLQHDAIADAIEQGDGNAARALLGAHLQQSAQALGLGSAR